MSGRTRRSTFTAASALLALCTAVVVTGCGDSGSGTPTAAASGTGVPAATATAVPTPAASSTVEATTGSPTTTGPTTAPPSSDGSAAAADAGTANGPNAAAPAKAAPGTALTPAVQPAGLARLPMAPTFGWKPDGPLSSQDVTGRKISLTECASVAGATTWQQQGYLSQALNAAGQQLFSFSGPEAAHTAYQKLLADMDTCQSLSRKLQAEQGKPQDATVIRTAATADGTSWSRTWTGVGGMSAPEHQTNHLYALQQGAVLTLFQFDERDDRPGPAHDNGTDPSVLAALAALGAKH